MLKAEKDSSPWDIPKLTPNDFGKMPPKEKLTYLLQCASLAPSTHNTQPWAFELAQDFSGANLFIDRGLMQQDGKAVIDQRRILPYSDTMGRQACISFGCALENIVIASQYLYLPYNIRLENLDPVDVLPVQGFKEERYVLGAHFDITDKKLRHPGRPAQQDHFEAIFSRRAMRVKFDPNLNVSTQMLAQVRKQAGVQLHLFSREQGQVSQINDLAELQKQADLDAVNNIPFFRELGKFFLPNDSPLDLGMPGNTFGLSNDLALHFSRGLRGEERLQSHEILAFANSSQDGIRSSSLVGIVTITQDRPESWIRAGIMLEDIALTLEANKVAMAFHAALAEVPTYNYRLRTLFGLNKQFPAILFRAGYTNEDRPHAPRKTIDEFWKQ